MNVLYESSAFLLGTVTDLFLQSKILKEKTMAPGTPVSAMATFEMARV